MMNEFIIILDFILIGMAIWMVTIVTGYGGIVGKAFNEIGWGAMMLGAAHLLETISFHIFGFGPEVIEISHRIIVLAGFVLIVAGFRKFVLSK